ncbi:hypothetical protein [Halobacillus sp. Marseille-P3879]|uniref:hypothetical protein n=1 Tax=Halobacillus sp. Marseille-P3879 TaxID=2045014 RepID=UPI000C79C3BD|nr:hypothetical protein [Halobacillus sp. Marseille-P3879]
MLKVLILVAGLIGIYELVKKELPKVKYSVFAYFVLLSAVFAGGLFHISTSYQLNKNPIDGGFSALYEWVGLFSYFFIVPLVILLFYKIYKWTPDSANPRIVKGILMVTITVAGIISLFFFILIFYGFAP